MNNVDYFKWLYNLPGYSGYPVGFNESKGYFIDYGAAGRRYFKKNVKDIVFQELRKRYLHNIWTQRFYQRREKEEKRFNEKVKEFENSLLPWQKEIYNKIINNYTNNF